MGATQEQIVNKRSDFSILCLTQKKEAESVWSLIEQRLQQYPPEEVSVPQLLNHLWKGFCETPGAQQLWLAVETTGESPRIVGHCLVWADYYFQTPFLSVFVAQLDAPYFLSEEQRQFFFTAMREWAQMIKLYAEVQGYVFDAVTLRFGTQRKGFQRYLSRYLPHVKTRYLHAFALT